MVSEEMKTLLEKVHKKKARKNTKFGQLKAKTRTAAKTVREKVMTSAPVSKVKAAVGKSN